MAANLCRESVSHHIIKITGTIPISEVKLWDTLLPLTGKGSILLSIEEQGLGLACLNPHGRAGHYIQKLNTRSWKDMGTVGAMC